MSADESVPVLRPSSRRVERVALPAGPARDLRDAVYMLYGEAGRPRLDDLAAVVAADDTLPGSPSKDVIAKIVAGDGLGSQQDVVSVSVALARAAGGPGIAAVADRARQLWTAAWIAPPPAGFVRLGRPIRECDPFDLEVHRAIAVPDRVGGSTLPRYVPRAHDARLAEAVAAAAAGHSGLVALIGGSSTGKTRACWEAVQALPEQWRLWHPIDPTRPESAAAALGQAGAHTVVWLNEAQHYLLLPHDSRLGEQVASGLRTLLRDPHRGPVLVLATMWPQYWDTLTATPTPGGPDPYDQARQLLAGAGVRVPDAFTAADLQTLRDTAGGDTQLNFAVAHSEGGRVTQQLAGVPALMGRYTQADPVATAVINVAIDARRLGHPLPIPHALLEQAAPGYLTDQVWDQAGDDWLEEALAYTAKPCQGVPGPLTRIRPRPGETAAVGGPHYRLADYLEQTGRTQRVGLFPPASFWNAAARVITNPGTLRGLGLEAERRSRYQRAYQLYRQAAGYGDPGVLREMAWRRVMAGDRAGAEALYRQAANRGDTDALQELALRRDLAGDRAGAEALYRQAANLGDTDALRESTVLRKEAGDDAGAEALALRAADRRDPGVLRQLAWRRVMAGDRAWAEVLYRQAADLGDIGALQDLARLREEFGDRTEAEALALQAADRGDPGVLRELAWRRDRTGDRAGAEALYRQAANRGDTDALQQLGLRRDLAGDRAGAETLYRQAADRGDTGALYALAVLREEAGDDAGAEALALQAADRGDPGALRELAELREQAGDRAGAEALYRQAADRGDTDALRGLAVLREEAGDDAGAEALALQAADRGDPGALRELAELRDQAGDRAGAEALYRLAANSGDPGALQALAVLRDRSGDPAAANGLRQFGLADDGLPATVLQFD